MWMCDLGFTLAIIGFLLIPVIVGIVALFVIWILHMAGRKNPQDKTLRAAQLF